MNKSLSISSFSLSPNVIKKHKRFSSDINENPGNQYTNFIINEKIINLLKEEIMKYSKDYNLLISELNFWKKIFDKKILTFLNNIQGFLHFIDIKFVENFDSKFADTKDFLKLKSIYSYIFHGISNINKKIDMPFLNNKDFSLSKNILNELISSNNDINNTNKFIDCTTKVLNYLIELNKKCQYIEDIKNNNVPNARILTDNSFVKEIQKSNYNENKIIEKFIDFKENNNFIQKDRKLSLSVKSYNNTISKNTNEKLNINKNVTNNLDSLKTYQSSNDIWKTPKSHQHKNIYFRKSATPIISESFCKNFKIENMNKQNDSINLILNSTKTLEGNKYLNRSCSMNNNIRYNESMKFLEFSSMKTASIKQNNNIFNSCEKNILNNTITDLKKSSTIKRREKEQKTFVHRKMNRNNNIQSSFRKNVEKLNIRNHIRSNSNLIPSINDKIFSFKNININNNTYLNNKSINFLNNTKNNGMNTSLFRLSNFQKEDSKKMNNYEKTTENFRHNPTIKKLDNENKILIDANFPLCLGIDLGDTDCKLSLVNGVNNEIQLINFKKDSFSIPTIIYFNSKKEEIKIGFEAENQGSKEPTQIIFNLLKYIGINYNETIQKSDLLPFKIFKNENNNRPYVKINFNGQKNKSFYFEDILSLYLKNLFEFFFNRITLKNEKTEETHINLYLELALPNYLNYLQKKIIEKIFNNQIFPHNVIYNGYSINLIKINFENLSSISYLYDIIRKNEDETITNSIYKNVLIILIDKFSVNFSIVRKNKMNYEVKEIENADFGEENFIDNYLYYCIKKLENEQLIKSSSFLYKLKNIISSAKQNFDIIPQTQINIDKESSSIKRMDKNIIRLILRKDDYEKSCEEYFRKISMLILNITAKSKLSISDIDDIILIGQTSNTIKMKKLLLDIFKKNEKISNILMSDSNNNDIDSENLISIGCSIQSLNKNNLLLYNYCFIDICSSSFGVESIDGLMEIIIKKGNRLPSKNKKLVKIKCINENIFINLFEGEDRYVKNNKFIICAKIDKSNLRKNISKNFIEVFIHLELDKSYNLKCFIHDPYSKNRFECLININVVKN